MELNNLSTKIFLDSGDPTETREALSVLGFLDGQTTNPSLIAKNPNTAGKKFSRTELLKFYRGVVEEISSLIPKGSVSIEIYADKTTSAEEMLKQAREFNGWIPNAHIKYPTTKEGLRAAEISVKEGMRVNMTLVFSQEQAAAVYAATKGAKKGQVFLSPFVGRLDDRGEQGMDLIKNIVKMYHPFSSSPFMGEGREGVDECHVEVLTASVRSVNHIIKAINLGSDIITAPLKVYQEWIAAKKPLDSSKLTAVSSKLKSIEYQEINLNQDWGSYNLYHELTDKGLEKFAEDWSSLIE